MITIHTWAATSPARITGASSVRQGWGLPTTSASAGHPLQPRVDLANRCGKPVHDLHLTFLLGGRLLVDIDAEQLLQLHMLLLVIGNGHLIVKGIQSRFDVRDFGNAGGTHDADAVVQKLGRSLRSNLISGLRTAASCLNKWYRWLTVLLATG